MDENKLRAGLYPNSPSFARHNHYDRLQRLTSSLAVRWLMGLTIRVVQRDQSRTTAISAICADPASQTKWRNGA
jgi:hypothetical protein